MNLDEVALGPIPLATTQRMARTPRKREPVFLALVSLALAAVCIMGAAAFLKLQPASDTTVARCYTVDRLGNGTAFTGAQVSAAGPPGSAAQVDDAVAHCSGLWKAGFLTRGSGLVADSQAGGANHEAVPNLVACTLPDGIAAVFPGDASTCGTLGLATPPR